MTPPDPATSTYRNACFEAKWVAVLWALNLAWTVGYCYLFGYQHTPESWVVRFGLADPWSKEQFHHIAGFPNWILFGVVIPWVVMTVITILFAIFVMSDDDLGVESEEDATHGH